MKRKQLSEKHKQNIRESCLTKHINKGSKNGMWKDGRTRKIYICQTDNCNNQISYRAYYYGTKKCYCCSHKGKLHTIATKTKISQANKGKRNGNYKNGIKNRQVYCIDCETLLKNKYSKRCRYCSSIERAKRPMERLRRSKQMKGNKNPMYGKLPKHGIAGVYKGIKMRSSYELAFARWLTLSNIKWKYESKTFDLGNTTYTPDFYLPEFDCYVEIKGIWIHDAKEKFEKFKSLYPDIDIRIVDKKSLNETGVMI